LSRRTGAELGTPAALPAFALSLALAATVLGGIGNQLSRQVEEHRDTFAAELTDDPRALIDLQRRLAIANVSDPDPPGIVTALLRTHPTTIERIGPAGAWGGGGGAWRE